MEFFSDTAALYHVDGGTVSVHEHKSQRRAEKAGVSPLHHRGVRGVFADGAADRAAGLPDQLPQRHEQLHHACLHAGHRLDFGAGTHPQPVFPAGTLFHRPALVVFPLLVYALLLPFDLDRLLVDICVLMTAMPAGSSTSILANQYDCNAVFASEIIFTSTLFSIATIPLLSLLF